MPGLNLNHARAGRLDLIEAQYDPRHGSYSLQLGEKGGTFCLLAGLNRGELRLIRDEITRALSGDTPAEARLEKIADADRQREDAKTSAQFADGLGEAIMHLEGAGLLPQDCPGVPLKELAEPEEGSAD